jgi:ribosomal protein S18 acetylase RimI-like enzyme
MVRLAARVEGDVTMTAAREASISVREGSAADRTQAGTLVAPTTARGRVSLAMLREGRGQLWVALACDGAREELVGILLADTRADGEIGQSVGYIQELLVHPVYRRRGVAMHLLDAAEHCFFELQGLVAVTLMTTPENEGALRLYRSRGYGVDQVHLRKRRPEE